MQTNTDASRFLTTTHLFELNLSLSPPDVIGQTPWEMRRISAITGGSFSGERLAGDVVSGGDWVTVGVSGTLALDVRMTLRASNGDLIYCTYQGRWTFPEDVRDRLRDPALAPSVDPADYYFRVAPLFQTASTAHGWLNDVVAVGSGRRLAGGVGYQVFTID